MIPIRGERFGGQVPQIVGLRQGPERAHSLMGERGPQKQGREMGCMGAEDPPPIRNQSSKGQRTARGTRSTCLKRLLGGGDQPSRDSVDTEGSSRIPWPAPVSITNDAWGGDFSHHGDHGYSSK